MKITEYEIRDRLAELRGKGIFDAIKIEYDTKLESIKNSNGSTITYVSTMNIKNININNDLVKIIQERRLR